MPRLFSLTYGALPYWRRALSHLGSGNWSGDAPFTSPNIQKKYYPSNKMRPSTLFFLCRGEPTGTLMRNHCSDTCCHLQRTLARTVPKLVALSASLVRTAPMLANLSAYPRAYGSDACHPICVPSRVRLRTLAPLAAYPHAYGSDTCRPLQRSFILVSTHLIAPPYVRS